MDLIIINNAKNIGFSFRELNELRVRDFVELVDIRCNTGRKKQNIVKDATQEDIDKLLA